MQVRRAAALVAVALLGIDGGRPLAQEMAEKSDTVGYTIWKLILEAIDELQEDTPERVTVH